MYLEKNAQQTTTNVVYTRECKGSVMKVSRSWGGDIQYANPLIGTLAPPLPVYCQVPNSPIIQLPLYFRYKTCDMTYILETSAVWKITLIFEV